jgi:very-short-patch-repair endonuclease
MPSYHYKNSRQHTQRAQSLRKQAPKAERLLWNALSALHKTTTFKFRRQHPLHPYIADFACVKARLIIELDGPSHDTRQTYDAKRETVLRNQGWAILRFSNEDVQKNLEGIVLTILEKVRESLAKHP